MDTRSPIVVRKRPPVRMGFRPYVPDPEPVYSPESGTFDTFGLPPGAPAAPASALLPPAPRIPIGQDFGDEDLGLGSIGRDTAPNRFISDSANSLAKGSIGLGEFGAGVADTALTLNPANLGATAVRAAARAAGYDVPEPEQFRVGPALESVGWRPKETRQFLAEQDSPELQAARAEVAKAKGFFPSLEASVRNPSTVVQGSIESLPSMAAGGAVSRTLMGLAPKIAPAMAAGFGEGLVQTGQAAEGTRQETGTLTPVQAAAAGVSGAIDAVISRFAGRVADRLKIPGADPDVLMTGAKGLARADEGLVKRVVGGLVREGLLEELPQSAQEQFFQNVATGRPWMEGVAEAGVQGGLAGALMGGAANVFGGESATEPPPPGPEPAQNRGEGPVSAPTAPIPPRAPKTDMAAQLVLEAEMAGKSGLDALLAAGMSAQRAKRELQRVRDLVGPKVAPAKAVDTAEDRKAAARRPDADKILADLVARERAGRPSPADEIASFEQDPLAIAAKRRRQGTPEEIAAYLEAAQKGIGTAEDEATIGAITDRARSEAQANLENQAYAPLLRKQEPGPGDTAVRAEAQRNLEEQWAREHADQFAVAEAGGPAFYVPKLIAKAVEVNSIKPLVDAGVPGSPSQLRKMLEKAKASAADSAVRTNPGEPSARPANEGAAADDGQGVVPGIGIPRQLGQLGEVGQEANGIAERVNPVGRPEQILPTGEAGPLVERPAGSESAQGGQGGEVHGESVPPSDAEVSAHFDHIAARVREIKRKEPNLPHRVIAQRVNQEFGTDNRLGRGREALDRRIVDEIMKPEINTQGVGPMNIMGKLADHPGYRGLVDQVRGKSTDEAVRILADAELKDWLIRPTIELAGGQAPTSKQVRAAVQEVSDRKQDEWFQSQNPDIVTAPPAFEGQRGAPFVEGRTIPGAEDRLSFLQRTAAERGNAPEITKARIEANKTKGADLAAALRGESAPVEAPSEQKPHVRTQSQPAVAAANEPAIPEVSGANRVAEQRPGTVGEETLREGRNVREVGSRPRDFVADEAPKAVEAHAESVPQKPRPKPEPKPTLEGLDRDQIATAKVDAQNLAKGIEQAQGGAQLQSAMSPFYFEELRRDAPNVKYSELPRATKALARAGGRPSDRLRPNERGAAVARTKIRKGDLGGAARSDVIGLDNQLEHLIEQGWLPEGSNVGDLVAKLIDPNPSFHPGESETHSALSTAEDVARETGISPSAQVSAIKQDKDNPKEVKILKALVKLDPNEAQVQLEAAKDRGDVGDAQEPTTAAEDTEPAPWETETKIPKGTPRFNGDAAEYTGKTEQKFGSTWHEARFTEGHQKGSTRWFSQRQVDDFQKDAEAKANYRPPPDTRPAVSTEKTKAGTQVLLPGAEGMMDTTGKLGKLKKGQEDVNRGPLFTQAEEAEKKADAARQTSLEDETAPEGYEWRNGAGAARAKWMLKPLAGSLDIPSNPQTTKAEALAEFEKNRTVIEARAKENTAYRAALERLKTGDVSDADLKSVSFGTRDLAKRQAILLARDMGLTVKQAEIAAARATDIRTPKQWGPHYYARNFVEKVLFMLQADAAKQRTLGDQVEEPLTKVEKPATEPKPESAKGKIGDFGEKIGGARKDVWSAFQDRMKEAEGADILTEPLSKVWPEPDYEAMLEGGADPWTVAFMHASRDEVPAKPRVSYRVASWAKQTKILRDMAFDLVSGKIDVADARKKLSEHPQLLDVQDRAELYQLVGHGKSLSGVRVRAGSYSLIDGVKYNPPKTFWTVEKKAAKTAFSNWPNELARAETREAAIKAFKEKYDSLQITPAANKTDFVVYTERKNAVPKFFVGKKLGRNIIQLGGPFETVKEARAYRNENQAALEAKLEEAKKIPPTRRETNEPRVGEDMRNGQDVTKQLFEDSFGFRGVEFGNWVGQKKRQADLNDAFDSLMDMAAIIGVPPKALSLNGELGLAFGARGGGGVGAAAAHYEPDKIVINITKEKGAGSIGHEWFHAVDNYFSRMRGERMGHVTESPAGAPGPVRQEMLTAFRNVMNTIRDTALKARSWQLDKKRSSPYWTTSHEMAARAYESYLISKLQDQNASNDYLANIVDEATWDAAASLGFEMDKSYPYPTAGEIPKIREAFDDFFKTVQTKETDKGVAMFDRKPSAPSFSRPTTPFFSQLERAAEQMKQPMRGAEALRFLSTREGVKAAELKWTGLDDFLQKRGGERVTPEDVKEFLKANKVTVTEVTKGYDRVDKAFDGWTDEDVVTHYGDVFGSAPEDGMTIEQMKREISNAEEEGMEGGTGAPSTPKFSQYQTPGGTNYREVLLTLPPKAEGAAGLTVDAIAKRLGYSGWHSSLTEDQKARVNAAFAAQPYGPGKGPEVEPGRGAFRSSHFDEPNILAHVRLNDRTVNGKKVLFVEEIQSDYGQMARRNGIFGRRWGLLDNSRVFEYVEGTRQEAEALAKKRSEEREALGLPSEVTVVQPKNGAVPDAPFIEKTEEWTALALKAILHKASTEGYDSVAFTTGDMQNARYDLAKQVDKIQAFHRKDGTFDLMVLKKGDRSYTDINKLTPSQLEDNIGKDLAAKIVEQPQEGATGAGWKTYEGLDLAVGGKGMRAFYDKIVPQVAEKIGKKWGAKVGTMNFRAGGEDPHSWKIVTRDARFRVLDSGGQLFPNEFDVKEQAEKFIRDAKAESALSGAPVHSIAITPEMRASVTSEGFPLFQRTDQTTEEAWQHYDSKDGEKTTLSPTAYRDGGRIVGAPPDVRVVDFMGDVDKSVLTDMAKSRASLAHYVASAERQIQRAVPGFKFGGFTPAGNLHGVNFQGRVFLNDLATHQIALEIVSAERITYPEAYARAMWDVILHESAHYAEKGHKGPFLAELDRIETEVGPQAIRAIKRDFMRYASEEKHRTQTQKMYEKALPGWREGERRGREAAARAETRSGGLRTRPDVATGLFPRPRGDTRDSEGVRGEGDGSQGSLFAPDRNQAEGLAAPADVRGTDGRGVEPPAPAFARKPAAPAPTPEELKDPTFWEKVMETRRAFILASWRFLGGNVAGNTISQLSGLAEIPLTAFWDRKMNPGQRRVFAEELNRAVSAIISIGPQASKKLKTDLWDTIKQKENLGSNENEEGKYEQQHRAIGGGKNSSAAEKKLGTAIRTILRMAEITDRFYKTLSWEQSVSRQAYRIARGEGLMGAAASSRADKMMEDFRTTFGSREATLKELRSDKGTPAQRRMLENSHRESRYRTYTLPANAENAGWFGEIAQWIKAAEKWKVVGPIVQSQFLFKNTPANVAFQGFERSPIAWFSVYDKLRALNDLKKKIEAAPDADTRAALESGLDKKAEAATDAMARATMGSAIAAIGFGLAAAGLLTGSGPPDPDDREQWMNAGNIPNAIKIGDHWFAFDKLDSMTTALALAANMTQAKNEKDASKMGGAFLNALQSAFIDNSYLNSFGRLSDMISLATKDPERAISKWLQDVEGSFVPAFVRQTAEFVDPVVRSKRGWIAPIKSGIPGLSKSLPAVRTGTGEPAKRTQRLGESVLGPLSPFGFMRTGDAKGDPLAKEFMAADYAPEAHKDYISIGVGPVGAKIQHRVNLTQKELEVFRNADEQTTKRLREIIKSDQWARLSAEQKKGYFQKVYAAMGAKAKEAVMPGVVARLRSKLSGGSK